MKSPSPDRWKVSSAVMQARSLTGAEPHWSIEEGI